MPDMARATGILDSLGKVSFCSTMLIAYFLIIFSQSSLNLTCALRLIFFSQEVFRISD